MFIDPDGLAEIYILVNVPDIGGVNTLIGELGSLRDEIWNKFQVGVDLETNATAAQFEAAVSDQNAKRVITYSHGAKHKAELIFGYANGPNSFVTPTDIYPYVGYGKQTGKKGRPLEATDKTVPILALACHQSDPNILSQWQKVFPNFRAPDIGNDPNNSRMARGIILEELRNLIDYLSRVGNLDELTRKWMDKQLDKAEKDAKRKEEEGMSDVQKAEETAKEMGQYIDFY